MLRNLDPTKRYIINTNASAYAIRVTISQDFKDEYHLIAYFSKSLLSAK